MTRGSLPPGRPWNWSLRHGQCYQKPTKSQSQTNTCLPPTKDQHVTGKQTKTQTIVSKSYRPSNKGGFEDHRPLTDPLVRFDDGRQKGKKATFSGSDADLSLGGACPRIFFGG